MADVEDEQPNGEDSEENAPCTRSAFPVKAGKEFVEFAQGSQVDHSFII